MSRATVTRAALSVLVALSMPGAPAGADSRDPRSVEVLRYGCGSEFGRREITLFANGTVRLREGAWDDQELYLEELTPEALGDNLRILSSVYSEREIGRIRQPIARDLVGTWLERCQVYLELPNVREPLRYDFTAQDVLPLAVKRMIDVAEDLALFVRPAEESERLPKGYEPKFGDVLRTAEGYRYRVLGRTVDGAGVELMGISQPLRIYVALEDLDEAFVAVESSDSATGWLR